MAETQIANPQYFASCYRAAADGRHEGGPVTLIAGLSCDELQDELLDAVQGKRPAAVAVILAFVQWLAPPDCLCAPLGTASLLREQRLDTAAVAMARFAAEAVLSDAATVLNPRVLRATAEMVKDAANAAQGPDLSRRRRGALVALIDRASREASHARREEVVAVVTATLLSGNVSTRRAAVPTGMRELREAEAAYLQGGPSAVAKDIAALLRTPLSDRTSRSDISFLGALLAMNALAPPGDEGGASQWRGMLADSGRRSVADDVRGIDGAMAGAGDGTPLVVRAAVACWLEGPPATAGEEEEEEAATGGGGGGADILRVAPSSCALAALECVVMSDSGGQPTPASGREMLRLLVLEASNPGAAGARRRPATRCFDPSVEALLRVPAGGGAQAASKARRGVVHKKKADTPVSARRVHCTDGSAFVHDGVPSGGYGAWGWCEVYDEGARRLTKDEMVDAELCGGGFGALQQESMWATLLLARLMRVRFGGAYYAMVKSDGLCGLSKYMHCESPREGMGDSLVGMQSFRSEVVKQLQAAVRSEATRRRLRSLALQAAALEAEGTLFVSVDVDCARRFAEDMLSPERAARWLGKGSEGTLAPERSRRSTPVEDYIRALGLCAYRAPECLARRLDANADDPQRCWLRKLSRFDDKVLSEVACAQYHTSNPTSLRVGGTVHHVMYHKQDCVRRVCAQIAMVHFLTLLRRDAELASFLPSVDGFKVRFYTEAAMAQLATRMDRPVPQRRLAASPRP